MHTRVHVRRPIRSPGKSHASLEQLVTELAGVLSDPEIARVLNMKKMSTPGGLRWTQDRVMNFRRQRRIHGPNKRDGGDDVMTMNQIQQYLGIGHNGVLALVGRGAITTNQITDFAPWCVSREQLDSEEVQSLVKILKQTGRLPRGGSPMPQSGLFDAEQGLTSEINKGAL